MRLDTNRLRTIHFTGIKGVGMTALALCYQDMGIVITGSDTEEEFVTDKTLKKRKLTWLIGFKKENIGKPDLLIYTGAHGGEDNIEVAEAKRKGIPVLSHAQALGMLMESKTGISVCGVGGKTTTASIIANILDKADLHPSFSVGAGTINSLGVPGRFDKKGRYFVAEADEYCISPSDCRPRFSYQKPKIIVVTNIEFDHPDFFKNLDSVFSAFEKFINRLPKDGLLLVNIDNKNSAKLLKRIKVPTQTYGFSLGADWQVCHLRPLKDSISFDVKHNNKLISGFSLNLPGRFNCLNACAALVVCQFLGLGIEKTKQGISSFTGVKRRFELVANVKGISFYDDYAHHPTEIRQTLQAARDWFKAKRIIAIFQPHTYSRTKALMLDFAQSFDKADKTIIVDIYASARETAGKKKIEGIDSQKLVGLLKKYSPNAVYKANKKQLIKYLKRIIKRGDVIITLGAGDIFLWHKEIVKAFQ